MENRILHSTKNFDRPGEVSNILFVDDEKMVVRSLVRVFNQEPDLNIFTATSGSEALEIIKAKNIAIIVCDQRMPQMSGYEVLKQVKYISPNTIPIILTGYADQHAATEAVNSGKVFQYLTKPWKRSDIVEVVHSAIRRFEKLEFIEKIEPVVETSSSERTSNVDIFNPIEILFLGDFSQYQAGLVAFNSSRHHQFHAESFDSAVHLLNTQKIQLIVVNISNHAEQNLDFLSAVKSKKPNISIVAIEQNFDFTTFLRCTNSLQVSTYLVWPFSEQELMEATNKAILEIIEFEAQPEANPIHDAPANQSFVKSAFKKFVSFLR